MQVNQEQHIGMTYEELTEMVDEFFAEVEEFLHEDEEIDVETVLRFIAALIYENNVRLRQDIEAGRVQVPRQDDSG